MPASQEEGVAKALVERAGAISPIVSKLLLMLAERDRLVLLPDIARLYSDGSWTIRSVRGEVTTAAAARPEKLRALEQGLAQATGRTVVLARKSIRRSSAAWSRASAAPSTTAA